MPSQDIRSAAPPASAVYRGFILQPTYRLGAGRPVVHLSGRLESGETFLVRDDRARPSFYVRSRDGEAAARLGAAHLTSTALATLYGREPVLRVQLGVPPDAPPLRDRLHQAGIPTFEADVRFASRFLIERGIRGGLEIVGRPRLGRGFGLVFDNPELRPGSWSLRPRVLSIDIETDPQARRLLSIALFGCGAAEVLLLTPPGLGCPSGAQPAASEKELLETFCRRLRELDPDVLTGWNVVDFDLKVLSRVAERLGVRLELGRAGAPLLLRPEAGRGSSLRASIEGRVVLDGLQLVRGAFISLEGQSLDAVARRFLGEGKRAMGERGGDRAEAILRRFHEDRPAFVDYNLTDARLVVEILDHLRLVELAVERSQLTGLPLDRVSRSIAAFDFLYLSALARRGLVAPTVRRPAAGAATGGGHVLEPEPGLYDNVLVLDFQSLYPSLIRTFQIDPAGWVPRPQPGDDLIVAPNGAAFRREPGILPGLLDELFPRREAAKKVGDEVASKAVKILMNSFYGVLGTPSCRFYDPALANAITSFGREVLLWTKERIEGYGHRVLYGDTDSLFVLVPAGEPDPRGLGQELAARLDGDLAEHVERRWRVESRLKLQLERLYLRLLLPPLRGATGGARKRYAGLIEEQGVQKVVFTGLEAVRSDGTELARQVQRELYRRLFLDEPVESYLRRTVAELRQGLHDERLVYRKALRKPLSAYTTTSPPHVVAARRMSRRPGRRIAYVITQQGPEPADERTSPLDHEHYVDRQILPVAEPVLAILGLDFRKLIGDDRQLELF